MPINPVDGSLRPFTPAEISAWGLGTRGIDDGSNPVERYSPTGSGCERPWLVAWGRRNEVIEHLLGRTVIFQNALGELRLSRLAPQLHPDTGWACTSARVTGHKFLRDYDSTGDGGNLIPVWECAEIEANYEQWSVNSLRGDELISSEIERYVSTPGMVGADSEPSAEYLQYPGGILSYKTADGSRPHGVPIQVNVGMTVGSEIVYAMWRRLPPSILDPAGPLFQRIYGNPSSGVLPFIGSVNKLPIFGRPPMSMVLLGAIPKTTPDPTGERKEQLEIKYRWLFRPQGHTSLWFFEGSPPVGVPPAVNGFRQVSRKDVAYKADPTTFADGEAQFPVRDHNLLFQPGS